MAPIYPMLLAAGAVACELAAERRPWLPQACIRTLIVSGLVIAPLALPILPPPVLLRYMRAIGQKPLKDENFDSGGLPQQYADMIGWPQLVSDFRSAYDTLSPEDRARVGIFCGNYGDASAINYLGPRYGLPLAISGHQNYFLWGPQGYTGELMLAIGGDQQDYEEVFDSVKPGGPSQHTLQHGIRTSAHLPLPPPQTPVCRRLAAREALGLTHLSAHLLT